MNGPRLDVITRLTAVRKYVARRRHFAAVCAAHRVPAAPDARAARLVAEVERNSYAVLPNYLSQETCARLRKEIDRLFTQFPDYVQPDKVGADHRLFGAEHGSTEIAQFHDDPFLHAVGETYFGGRMTNAATLAGRLDAKPDNLGSGQGWHRDSLTFQFKSFVYLSDVGPDNGPFQIVAGSHHLGWTIHDILRFGLDPEESRLSDALAARIVSSRPQALTTLTAPAGTCVLINSNAIHRGMPIRTGQRYYLFNYVYPTFAVDDVFMQKFAPVLTADATRERARG